MTLALVGAARNTRSVMGGQAKLFVYKTHVSETRSDCVGVVPFERSISALKLGEKVG